MSFNNFKGHQEGVVGLGRGTGMEVLRKAVSESQFCILLTMKQDCNFPLQIGLGGEDAWSVRVNESLMGGLWGLESSLG